MPRFLKNPLLGDSISQAALLPVVKNSGYGDPPVNGLIRFNAGTNKIEFYYGGAWNQVAKIGSVQLVVDDLVGDGTTTNFTMSQAETDSTAIVVTIGGVYQLPGTSYTVSGTTISFTSAPPAPSLPTSPNRINIIHNINSTNAV
jgi:hypothetical protein